MSQRPVPTVSREKDLLVFQLLADGRYYVEDDGSIFCAQWRNKGPKKLKQRRCKAGQWLVNLSTGGSPRQITALASRIVALAKYGDPGMPLGAVHKDGNLDNNHPDNLAWMDGFESMQKASSDGRLNIHHGETHKNAKLTEKQASKVKRMLTAGMSPTMIVREMVGVVSRAAIRQIQAGDSWRHV